MGCHLCMGCHLASADDGVAILQIMFMSMRAIYGYYRSTDCRERGEGGLLDELALLRFSVGD